MQKKIDGFTFYRSYYESIKELSNRDKKELALASLEFMFDEKTPDFKGIKRTAWSLLEPHFRVSLNRSMNARKNKSNENQNEIKCKSNKNQNRSNIEEEIEIEMEKELEKEEREKEKERTSFSPTLTNVLDCANTLGIFDTDYCRKFFNHYEAIGWVNGTGQEIKNWKLTFYNWAKKDGLLREREKQTYVQLDENGNLVEVEC